MNETKETKKVKIVHIIIGLNVGGAEMMLYRLVTDDTENELLEHIVISLTNSGPVGKLLKNSNITVYAVRLNSIYSSFKVFFRLRRILLTQRPDIVHTWMYHADLLGGLAARSVGIDRVVWCVRSTDISIGSSLITRLIKRSCAKLSHYIPATIVFAAHRSRETHLAVGYNPTKAKVVHNGFHYPIKKIQKRVKTRFRRKLGLSSEDRLIISVGRFNEVKDFETFFKAISILSKRYTDFKVLLVGTGLDHNNIELMSLIERSGYKEKYIFIGYRKNPMRYMTISDIFCLHSKSEGFPNVLGEAMSCGLACLSTDVGDAAILLGNSDWIVPVASSDIMAEKLLQLLKMPNSERLKLGNDYEIRIGKMFSMSSVSSNYKNVYEELLRSRA